jgi:hypothetical protein
MKPDRLDPAIASGSRNALWQLRLNGMSFREAVNKEAKQRNVDPNWIMTELAYLTFYSL